MVSEGGFNPVPLIVHAIGIAIGLFVGFLVMGAWLPDLPGDDVDPGVSATTNEPVRGDDPESLFLPNNLSSAMLQIIEQVSADEGIVELRLEPTSIHAETGTADGVFAPQDVPVAAPARIAQQLQAERSEVSLEDIAYMELIATATGPRWLIQFDSANTDASPPWTYSAPLEGSPIRAGGEAPKPVE